MVDLPVSFRPDAATHGQEVYFYADGDSGRETVTEYRNIRLAPALSTYVALTPAELLSDTRPSIEPVMLHPGAHRVQVSSANAPLIMTLAESFDDRWVVKNLPGSWKVRHVKVGGYANGWTLEPSEHATAAFTLLIEHQPTHWARRALHVSVLVACLALWMVAAPALARARARWVAREEDSRR